MDCQNLILGEHKTVETVIAFTEFN